MNDHRRLCCAHTPRLHDAYAVHTCILTKGHSTTIPHHCVCKIQWHTPATTPEPA